VVLLWVGGRVIVIIIIDVMTICGGVVGDMPVMCGCGIGAVMVLCGGGVIDAMVMPGGIIYYIIADLLHHFNLLEPYF